MKFIDYIRVIKYVQYIYIPLFNHIFILNKPLLILILDFVLHESYYFDQIIVYASNGYKLKKVCSK